MVGGHAPFTLSDDHLTGLAALAAKHDTWVHLHLAEAETDQKDAHERGHADVTTRLEEAGVLAGQSLLAHGVHLSAAEVARLGPGAWLTHQPRSNMNNHVGYFGAARAHGRVALGTDGINGDLFEEAHAAFFRLRDHDRDGAAEEVWRWIAGGWRLANQVFGLSPAQGFGRLSPGCPADFVVLDYDGPTPVHEGNLPWHLAFGMSARHVRHVVVAGEVVVRDGQPVKLDGDELRGRSREGAERLWSRMAAL
jgi:cytosine/adenosine deaminase-related metal-dependent hydrolase